MKIILITVTYLVTKCYKSHVYNCMVVKRPLKFFVILYMLSI